MIRDLFAPRGHAGQFPSVADRIDASGDCWEWTGGTTRTGYGMIRDWPEGQKPVHRVVWESLIGPIADGLTLDHLCRNRSCVNPDHLEPVTMRENTLRSPVAMAAKHARKTHCPAGHPYNDENTYLLDGRRYCRPCKNEWKRKDRAKRGRR